MPQSALNLILAIPSHRRILSPRSLRFGAFCAAGLLVAGGALGCEDENDSYGVLVITYELGNGKTCDEMGVETVRAELDDGFMVEEVVCERGELRFSQVPEGTYAISVYGLSASRAPVMDNLALGRFTDRVAGAGTVTTVEDVTLTAAPAQVKFRWDFQFSDCESAEIDYFHIKCWEANGSSLILEDTVDCKEAREAGGYVTIADPDRLLGGDLLGEVSVQPYDITDSKLGNSVTFVFDEPGAGYIVRLSVSCDEIGCTSVSGDEFGEPDDDDEYFDEDDFLSDDED